jgi:hypothetical protein
MPENEGIVCGKSGNIIYHRLKIRINSDSSRQSLPYSRGIICSVNFPSEIITFCIRIIVKRIRIGFCKYLCFGKDFCT